jgi:putative hemolysin
MKVTTHYQVRFARDQSELERAQALRCAVFQLHSSADPTDGALDCDAFDAVGAHLLLFTGTGTLVGTCRLITREQLISAHRGQREFYSATEFDLTFVPDDILDKGVELGRLAIEAPHRSGTAFIQLWRAIGDYLRDMRKRYLFGCVSIAGTSVPAAMQLLAELEARSALHPQLRVHPKANVARAALPAPGGLESAAHLPPLLKLYLAAGARICSVPVVDAQFGVCDVWTVLDTTAMRENYRRRFFAKTPFTGSSAG